ncbi:hypothetical protein IMCC3317_25810 [Kordia antarctica]|uniref:Chromosome partition protein Smc n=1 Tax=Kordia antarctica TaxID=1218801 RepID=A0A7L4ZKG8_9FLAO|nr:hypothetical protein [Kordia antarctica]QHI37203.1 hypothetical protein IMCC3317_25810 [Kordia antarctica]
MKNIFITTALILAFFQVSNAQTNTTSSSSTSSTTTVNDDNESTSVSVSHTDDDYKLRARFPKNREAKLKQLIQNTLGDKNLDIQKGYSKWSNGEKVYEIKLTEKTLRIWLDLNVASPDLIEKFETLGSDAKTIISGSSASAEKDRMQREADRMRREADRMQQEAKRLEQQVEREVKRETARIERDAKRIEREAKRLDIEAKIIEEKARHKGGISSHIKRLLDDSKTTYTEPSGSDLNWIWPEVQENLLKFLLRDKLIESTKEVTFTTEKDRMYVNGKELSATQYSTYNKMLRTAGIQRNADFSFYKKDDHIVVIGLNARIKKVFADLHKKGFIASTDEPVKLLIDGNSITQNGTRLSSVKVAAYNAILRDNGVIPAPGKYIEMKKAGSYRLGYSFGKKGIIGTWIEED